MMTEITILAKEELRVAGILSVCIMAGIAGVVWGQEITPPAYGSEEAAELAEETADTAELLAEITEQDPTATPTENLVREFIAEACREEATERENEIPINP